jgi:5-methylcytosine-specific restriction endonuclease McrA
MKAWVNMSTGIETIGALLHLSYANLASVDAAERRGLPQRDQQCWKIRAKLFKGLRGGTMNLGTLFADVMVAPTDRCAYCGAAPPPKLHADHLIPRNRGGLESGDNLVWACRSCNSSKNARDLLEWYAARGDFPSVFLMRRYLKLAIAEATSRGVMDAPLTAPPPVTFSIDYIPIDYPHPTERGRLTKREFQVSRIRPTF